MRLSLLVLLMSSENIYARMYQWLDADTGSTQLSGKPPVWYRGTVSGPRVFVFDNGRLIDDTDIDVDDEVRKQLRQKAFILVEEDKQEAKEKIAKSLELKQKYVKEEPRKPDKTKAVDFEEIPSVILTEDEPVIDEVAANDQEEVSVEDELRKLISDWDKAKTEDAKKALEQ